jgi:hypothetical protein
VLLHAFSVLEIYRRMTITSSLDSASESKIRKSRFRPGSCGSSRKWSNASIYVIVFVPCWSLGRAQSCLSLYMQVLETSSITIVQRGKYRADSFDTVCTVPWPALEHFCTLCKSLLILVIFLPLHLVFSCHRLAILHQV